jgi:hypothetical protein
VYTLGFSDPKGVYLTTFYSRSKSTADPKAATPVSVTSANASGINVQATVASYHITGTVTLPGGNPVSNIEVCANGSSYGTCTNTASNGTYSLAVPADTYTVQFWDNSGTYLNGFYSSGGFTTDQNAATPVIVTSADRSGIDVQLPLRGATYVPLTPARILDSRYGIGVSGAFSSHVAQTFPVTGHGGVPSNAVAVTGNLTVTAQTALGYLYLGPVAMNNPTSSTLNFPVGDDRANGVTVALSGTGTLSATYAAPTLGPTAQVLFDVTGYFQ